LGSDVILRLNQSLVASAAEGDSQAICKLIDDGACVDWFAAAGINSGSGAALHCASRNGHEDAVRMLLEVVIYSSSCQLECIVK
jgi:hypothetical protein